MTIAVAGKSAADNCRIIETILKKADKWAKMHASVFAPQKYVLTHFHNRKSGDLSPLQLDAAVTLSDGTVKKPESVIKFLGMYLDQRLTFREQRDNMSAKATTALNAMSALAGSN